MDIANYIKQLEELNKNYLQQIDNLKKQIANLEAQILNLEKQQELTIERTKKFVWEIVAVIAIGTTIYLFIK
ncbi:hypothetical protein XO08_07920 [Thermosipho sp. 1074]|nr:hypothetical protein XO08_07920 [Thermosipho sp. 1074]